MQAPDTKPATLPDANGDEIDLVEALGFLLRIKWFLMGGLLLGLGTGLLVAFVTVKATYNTKITVTIDPGGLPAIVDSKRVSEAYLGALGSPDLAAVAFRKLIALSPEFGKRLAERGVSIGDLVSTQALADKPGAMPLRVGSLVSTQDFSIEATFAEQGLGPEAGRNLLVAINDLATEHNSRAVTLFQESSKNMVRQATKAVEEAEASSTQVQDQHETELTRIRSDLARLEYRLTRRAQGAAALSEYLRGGRQPISVQLVSPNREGRMLAQASESDLDVDRVLRLVAALDEEKRITPIESTDFKKQLTALQLNHMRNEALYSSVLSANKAVMQSLYESMSKAVVPVDRASTYLPLFKMNEQLYTDELARRSFEVKSNRRSAVILVAALAGLALGMFLGSAIEFYRKNRGKFELLSRKA